MSKDEEEVEESQPLIEVYFDMSSGITEEDQLLFLMYLDALYREAGGDGLKILSDEEIRCEKRPP